MSETSLRDPVLEAVRARRKELCEKAGYDIHALCEVVRSVPLPPGSKVVVGKPKRVLETTGS